METFPLRLATVRENLLFGATSILSPYPVPEGPFVPCVELPWSGRFFNPDNWTQDVRDDCCIPPIDWAEEVRKAIE